MTDQAKMDRLIELTEALLRTRISELLDKELDDPKKRKLYELTGRKKIRDLSKLTHLSTGAISRLWQRWHSMGILKKQGNLYFKFFEEVTRNG